MNTATKLKALLLIAAAPTAVACSGNMVELAPFATSCIVEPDPASAESTIWRDGIGNGFLSSAQSLTWEAGGAVGFAAFGGKQAHDLALSSVSYGHMLTGVLAEGHWYRGNLEGRLELFGGFQVHPDVDTRGWLVGLTPHLRYNLATGTRWVPFVDAGAGATATGIGRPDLSGTYEFNLQATAGTHYFLRENLALTGDVRFMHLSCAGMHSPNLGANTTVVMLGLTWFFGK